MGLLPKYQIGQIVINTGFRNHAGEHLLHIEKAQPKLEGFSVNWYYSGKSYIVLSNNPLDLCYSTTSSTVSENSLVSLESRLRNPWDKK